MKIFNGNITIRILLPSLVAILLFIVFVGGKAKDTEKEILLYVSDNFFVPVIDANVSVNVKSQPYKIASYDEKSNMYRIAYSASDTIWLTLSHPFYKDRNCYAVLKPNTSNKFFIVLEKKAQGYYYNTNGNKEFFNLPCNYLYLNLSDKALNDSAALYSFLKKNDLIIAPVIAGSLKDLGRLSKEMIADKKILVRKTKGAFEKLNDSTLKEIKQSDLFSSYTPIVKWIQTNPYDQFDICVNTVTAKRKSKVSAKKFETFLKKQTNIASFKLIEQDLKITYEIKFSDLLSAEGIVETCNKLYESDLIDELDMRIYHSKISHSGLMMRMPYEILDWTTCTITKNN